MQKREDDSPVRQIAGKGVLLTMVERMDRFMPV